MGEAPYTPDLFGRADCMAPWNETVTEGVVHLHHYALAKERELAAAIKSVIHVSPLRHMVTPGGFRMSVSTSSCGQAGWITDGAGYRYSSRDPLTGKAWPEMPALFMQLAQSAANEAGYPDFLPDSCLINRYRPGTKMSLHQDKDERNLGQPIVSISLGLPAIFQFGGDERSDKTQRIALMHGDVFVWGGVSRLKYHGILPLKEGSHPIFGANRFNLTFRRAR